MTRQIKLEDDVKQPVDTPDAGARAVTHVDCFQHHALKRDYKDSCELDGDAKFPDIDAYGGDVQGDWNAGG